MIQSNNAHIYSKCHKEMYRKIFDLLWATLAVIEINSIAAQSSCPICCTCQLEHLSETAIFRFIENNTRNEESVELASTEFNDVLYHDTIDARLFQDKPIVRSAICILEKELQVFDLIDQLPDDIEALTFIQGYDSGNKSIRFSHLIKFNHLLSLELQGPNLLNKHTGSRLRSVIDAPLPTLKYLNFENVLLNASTSQIQDFIKEFDAQEGHDSFEYVQNYAADSHPLKMHRNNVENDEIVPYERYKEDFQRNPLFIGFKNLLFLRITDCKLNNIHWTMFDGLNNLEFLILDKNNLKFIPPFAFYGTPNLKTLSLSHNNLLDIEITDLAGLLELQYLDLTYNNFSQLSELSFPPFPNLKLANFGNNPISAIFPNTFQVMNTTDSLAIGSDDVPLALMSNSFNGLNLLKALTLSNVNAPLLKRQLFIGMPNLEQLAITGNVPAIEFDAFLQVYKLKKLILNNCRIYNISMDAFIGLEHLEILDLSTNHLETLPPAIFDQLINIKEIYLNDNRLTHLPADIFAHFHSKLIRLNGNPWHCSCKMSEWKPMIVNRIRRKIVTHCDSAQDKGLACRTRNRFAYKYVFDNRVAPKCASPMQFLNWNVFHVMRRLLKCPLYKPKIKKRISNKIELFNKRLRSKIVPMKIGKIPKRTIISNDLTPSLL